MGQKQSGGVKERVGDAEKTGRCGLSGKKLKVVPPRVWLLAPKLRSLDLSTNKIETLPPEIGTLTKLHFLKLDGNKLTSLPSELSKLASLKTLSAERNLLCMVPALPKKISTVNFATNRFSGTVGHTVLALPPSITSCDLSNNQITALDGAFGFDLLQHLEEWNLDNNNLASLPAEMGKMKKLTCLKVRNNRLTAVPKELLADTSLNRLHLEGNTMTKAGLLATEGVSHFMERRKVRLSKEIAGGLTSTDRSVCGLD